MPSHRKVNEESSSASGPSGTGAGGGFLSRWLMRRAQKRVYKEIMEALESHLAAGLPIEDFLVFYIEEEVEWDRTLQCWIVRVLCLGDIVLDAGTRVELARSRGGAKEDARIKEVIGDFVDVRSGLSGVIYSLEFKPLEEKSA